MKFTKNGSRATMNGPADWFTGKVLVDNVKSPDEQSAVGAGHVRFTPGARTAWHTHPQGQLLYVTDGEVAWQLVTGSKLFAQVIVFSSNQAKNIGTAQRRITLWRTWPSHQPMKMAM